MPELPEVETIKRELVQSGVLGHAIVGLYLSKEWLTEGRKRPAPVSPEHLKATVLGSRVLRMRRYGKSLLLDLSVGQTLLLHMGMSGVILLNHHRGYHHNAAAAIFILDNASRLFFFDTRRFGDIQLLTDSDDYLRRLGPDPLQPSFSLEVLRAQLQGRQAPIKSLLCDQQTIVGIGNIYSNEILFHAGIRPLTPGKDLTEERLQRLYVSIEGVLTEAVECGGTTLSDRTYQSPSGQPGRYVPKMYFEDYKVLKAGRQGTVLDARCPTCSSNVVRLKVNGRSGFYCPRCQPPERRKR